MGYRGLLSGRAGAAAPIDTCGPVVGEDGLAQDTAAAREESERQMEMWRQVGGSGLASRRKSDAVKLEIAARLRRETTLSTKAIAARVHLGSAKTANRSLHRYMHGSGVASAGQGQLGI